MACEALGQVALVTTTIYFFHLSNLSCFPSHTDLHLFVVQDRRSQDNITIVIADFGYALANLKPSHVPTTSALVLSVSYYLRITWTVKEATYCG